MNLPACLFSDSQAGAIIFTFKLSVIYKYAKPHLSAEIKAAIKANWNGLHHKESQIGLAYPAGEVC